MRIAICEDEEKYAEQLSEYIEEWAADNSVTAEIFVYITSEKFLYEWEDSEDYDLIFLDIKMGVMTGMELAKLIRKTNNNVAIVFATSMKEYIIKGYSVAAMQYLLKPVKKSDCFACLNRVYQSKKVKKYYLLNDIEKTIKIPADDIIYIEMYSHKANMVTKDKRYEFRKTITQILEELDDKLFVKCHKSFIINIRHVESVSKKYVVMSDKAEIPLSRDIASEINDMFIKYNMNKI